MSEQVGRGTVTQDVLQVVVVAHLVSPDSQALRRKIDRRLSLGLDGERMRHARKLHAAWVPDSVSGGPCRW